MKYSWKQPYPNKGKYERLYHAQRLLEVSRLLILLDRLEPITDLTESIKYLMKFRSER